MITRLVKHKRRLSELSLHRNCGHINGFGTLDFWPMEGARRLEQFLPLGRKQCSLCCFWRHSCEFCSLGCSAGFALAQLAVFDVQPREKRAISKFLSQVALLL
jgi:hypothetical protein